MLLVERCLPPFEGLGLVVGSIHSLEGRTHYYQAGHPASKKKDLSKLIFISYRGTGEYGHSKHFH